MGSNSENNSDKENKSSNLNLGKLIGRYKNKCIRGDATVSNLER